MQFILIEIINKLGYNNNSYYVKGGIVMIHLNIKSCYSFFNSALSVEEIVNALNAMRDRIDDNKLWVNPDCGLKTRGETETKASLINLVKAANIIRNDK